MSCILQKSGMRESFQKLFRIDSGGAADVGVVLEDCDYVQSVRERLLMCLKSRVLLVTSVASTARQCAAISISIAPVGFPSRSSWARSIP